MVRYKQGRREESRSKILEAAGRLFREKGFNGIGVENLMQSVLLTTGAFYGHFKGKAELFREVATSGLRRLSDGIGSAQKNGGDRWQENLAVFYFGQKHRADVGGGCALPSLTPDIVHTDIETRTAFQDEIHAIIFRIVDGLEGGSDPEKRARACEMLCLLAGGVMLARAVIDQSLADEIAAAAQAAFVTAGKGSSRNSSA